MKQKISGGAAPEGDMHGGDHNIPLRSEKYGNYLPNIYSNIRWDLLQFFVKSFT